MKQQQVQRDPGSPHAQPPDGAEPDERAATGGEDRDDDPDDDQSDENSGTHGDLLLVDDEGRTAVAVERFERRPVEVAVHAQTLRALEALHRADRARTELTRPVIPSVEPR